jgi:hypothetical protein
MNKYELAMFEIKGVLDEWLTETTALIHVPLAREIVDRLIAKGVIQSTDPEDLVDARS